MTDEKERAKMNDRPDNSNADEWNLFLVEHGVSSDHSPYIAVQIAEALEGERERAATLHESVNPASDDERLKNLPGAGAMGAVIEYRDLIRSEAINYRSARVFQGLLAASRSSIETEIADDAAVVKRMLELGDTRLLASEGPAGDRLPDLTPEEWGKVYRACKRISVRSGQYRQHGKEEERNGR